MPITGTGHRSAATSINILKQASPSTSSSHHLISPFSPSLPLNRGQMPRRPLSDTADDDERPYTAAGRPTTSSGPPGAYDHPHGPQYTSYSIEEDEEEEEESDAEDLFAFLPPTTADQQRDLQQQQQEQQQRHQPDFDQMFAASLPPPHDYTPIHPLPSPISPPAPTFDPYARYPADAAVGPSSLRSPAPALVETPPSTGTDSAADPYQMRRVNNTASTGVSSREVRVSLPSAEKQLHHVEEARMHHRPSHGKRHSSTLASTLSSPSALDDDDEYPSSLRSVKMEFDFDAIDEEDSPYPEVRASVSNIDDPDMPSLTLRMWFIGLTLTCVSGALNVFFNFRYPAPSVVPLTLLLVSYPVGKFLAFTLPITTYRLPRWLGGVEFSLNPGPWNIKEHVLVFIMANVAVGTPYALNAIVVAEKDYDISFGFWFNIVFVLATQLTGFGLAGLCRRFLVWPASMVWPQNLVACTLLNTLHAEDDEGMGGVTRFRYFMYVMGAGFFFYFLPGYLFQALSIFSFACWIAPNNVPVNQMFGVRSGLGMGFLTFDWTQITWIGSPLMIPWWAEVHIFIGFVAFYWVLVPALYYSNSWQLAYFPISANDPYDRFGARYNLSRVLSSEHRFDSEAYENYSPLYLPATYAMTYLLAFTLSTCVLVHTLLYHGQSLLNGFKRIRVEPDDIHAKLMRNYPEVPDWWYAVAFVTFFGLAIVANEVWRTSVPVWALLLSVLLPIIYVLPSGFIYAMTGQGISVNILAQIIPGTLLPGNPLANMIFKSYSVQTLIEASSFVQDLKLGHYIKVPPRATFFVQAVATILAAFIQTGVKHWMFASIPDICDDNQKDHFVCPHNQVFLTASAVWGLIGPTRQFGPGTILHPQLYAIAVGAVLPIPFWLWQRRYPSSWVKFINTPVILNGVSFIPPATGINYSSWFVVGFIFQYVVRKRNFAWWSKFNYVTSAALDSGTVLSLIVIFFTLQFPKGGVEVNWWGNSVFENTADYARTPWKPLPEGGLPLS